jgi:flagellar hook-associated protein 1 FlgK
MSLQALEIARNALTASRGAMEITGQNVANANTPGYLRQRARLTPLTTLDPAYNGITGGGVTIAEVQRLRNQCLEAQINHQAGIAGQERGRYNSLMRVEACFTELVGQGVTKSFGEFCDALLRLQTEAGSQTARQEVVSRGNTLCEEFRFLDGRLRQERTALKNDLENQVAQANNLLGQVADLNARITALGDNPGANDLRGARELAIRKLAELCGAIALDQPDGSQDVLIGGQRIVQGSHSLSLGLQTNPADPEQLQFTIAGQVASEGLGGRIAGQLEARDVHLRTWRSELGEVARALAEAFNATHQGGFDGQGNAGGNLFLYDASGPAATLRFNPAIRDDLSLLAAASQPGAPGDGGNAARLALLRQEPVAGGVTVEEAYGRLLYDIGARTNKSEQAVETREGMVRSLELQYSNEAGVSLDEEAIEIMRFQQAYNAAARLVQVSLEMMDTVLRM